MKHRLNEIKLDDDLRFLDYKKTILQIMPYLIRQAELLSNKYDVCITNPPYMGSVGMNEKLINYSKCNYPMTKGDLSTMFMEKLTYLCNANGILGMLNIPVWMFLSSYEKLRVNLIKNNTIINMIHLGRGVFGSDFGTTAFIIRNNKIEGFKSKFNRLFEETGKVESVEKKERLFFQNMNRFIISQNEFLKIPGSSISYWISDSIIKTFQEDKIIEGNYGEVRQGLKTADNNRFLRLWHEINSCDIGFGFNSADEANNSKLKWFPYNKGGKYRKWFGNDEYVINWKDNGADIKDTVTKRYPYLKGNYSFVVKNESKYFKEQITWTTITSGKLSMRYKPSGYLFDGTGSSIFNDDKSILLYLLGLLNSKVGESLLGIISPTISFEVGHIAKIPVKIEKLDIINDLVQKCINIVKSDWDDMEISWGFDKNPLLIGMKIETAYETWVKGKKEKVLELKQYEEKINEIFIHEYKLNNELNESVDEDTLSIKIINNTDSIKAFISYAVGCMFGRYSIDTEGLIYAGGEFSDRWKVEEDKWNVRKIEKNEEGNITSDSWVNATFVPDVDNIIPITEDEYFEDDIVSRFIEFVKVVYGAETLEENLDFIAESLGVKVNETSRQTIRRYFLKEFYKDHLKVYQKRPIYWMFDSGKNDGFKALVYMHRYNESTVAKLRTDYLHSLQRKYEAEILRLQVVAESTTLSAREKTQARKKIDKINKQIEECKLYDQVVAHVANERISIDLDDGVKHNYGLFQGVKVPTDSGNEVKMDLLAKI